MLRITGESSFVRSFVNGYTKPKRRRYATIPAFIDTGTTKGNIVPSSLMQERLTQPAYLPLWNAKRFLAREHVGIESQSMGITRS